MFTKDDYLAARSYLELCCPKPEAAVRGLIDPAGHKEKRDLDIIIPCFNEEKYLVECLESVVHYPFRNKVSVILVDDGSTDRSGEIADEYASLPNMTVIHQENKGFSGARNTGVSHSSSKYLFFLDSDDYVLPERLDEVLSFALRQDADAIGGVIFNVADGEVVQPELIPNSRTFESVTWNEVSGYAGGMLVKSSLFEDICFPEGYLYEDCIMALLLAPRYKKAYRYGAGLYAYRLNPEGVTAKSQGDIRSIHSYWVTELMLETIPKIGIRMDNALYDGILAWVIQTYARTRRMDDKIRLAIFIATCGLLQDLVREFSTTNRFRKPLEDALRSADYGLYIQGCELAWQALRSGAAAGEDAT